MGGTPGKTTGDGGRAGTGFTAGSGRADQGACRHRLRPARDGTLVCRSCGFRRLPLRHDPEGGETFETAEERRIRRMRARDPGGYRTRAMRRAELLQDIVDFLKDHLRWMWFSM